MELKALCTWLRANSSGVYRPANDAADAIERLADALVSRMDGEKDHEISEETGLPDNDCLKIAEVRAEAARLVYGA